MHKFKKAFYYLHHKPSEIFAYGFMKSAVFLPDDIYLKILFRLKMGRKLDLINPETFTAKLQWLKLYDRNPKYTNMVDKYEAKKIAASIIGEEYIIPTYGVWDSFDEIDLAQLPKQFVLKTTHGGGNRDVILCKDKNNFNIKSARKVLSSSIKRNAIYKNFREWPYKNIKPRIIAEQYLEEESRKQLTDYKFYCFNGEPKIMMIVSDRMSKGGPYFDYYDGSFKHLPFTQGGPNNPGNIKKPILFEKMLELAKALSKDIPHVRIDMYSVSEHVYFGEWTFFDASGYEKFTPEEWDYTLGSWIKLPEIK